MVRPGEGARAVEALQRAVDLGYRSPEVRTKLANLWLQQGNVMAAIGLYRESLQIEPLYTPAYLDLARAYLMLEDLENAREILDRVLKIDPGNDATRQAWLKLGALPTSTVRVQAGNRRGATVMMMRPTEEVLPWVTPNPSKP